MVRADVGHHLRSGVYLFTEFILDPISLLGIIQVEFALCILAECLETLISFAKSNSGGLTVSSWFISMLGEFGPRWI